MRARCSARSASTQALPATVSDSTLARCPAIAASMRARCSSYLRLYAGALFLDGCLDARGLLRQLGLDTLALFRQVGRDPGLLLREVGLGAGSLLGELRLDARAARAPRPPPRPGRAAGDRRLELRLLALGQ